MVKQFEETIIDRLDKDTNALALALGYRDRTTYLHSHRVASLAHEMALACGFSTRQLEILKISAVFHDIGNMGIPDLILIKPGRLNKNEFSFIMKHTEIGEHILESATFEGSEDVGTIIRHHHEYFDGSGYPDGFSGEDIPIYSRIIGIADSYDAMAYPRLYSFAKTHTEIMEILFEESGRKHDPYFLNIFAEVIEKSLYKARAL